MHVMVIPNTCQHKFPRGRQRLSPTMAEQLLESDDGDGSAGMEVKQATFYKWKFRHYFTVVEEGDKNM